MFYTKLLCVGEELYGQYDSVGDIITLKIRVDLTFFSFLRYIQYI